jgi:hypothetical protein
MNHWSYIVRLHTIAIVEPSFLSKIVEKESFPDWYPFNLK